MVLHVITNITDSDWEEFVEVKFRSFAQEEFCFLVNGSNTAENRERCKNKYASPDFAGEDVVCLKVVDVDEKNAEGGSVSERILGAAIYRVNPVYSVDLSNRAVLDPNTMTWLDDPEDRKISVAILHDVMDRKTRFINEAHIQLDTLFVDPEHQRKGIATLLVNWGIQLSQQRKLPLWLEASETGSNLYPKLGFSEVIRTRLMMGKWDIKYSLFRLEPPEKNIPSQD